MRFCLTLVAFLLMSSSLAAAPKDKLEALCKEIPALAAKWGEGNVRIYKDDAALFNAKVIYQRLVGEQDAKVTLLLNCSDPDPANKSKLVANLMVTIRLHFFEGAWSVTNYEGSWWGAGHHAPGSLLRLMFLIDEAATK